MLTAADWLRMKAEMEQVRTDRSISVEFRRGETVLDPQDVRIEAVGRSARLQSDAARAAQAPVIVFGASDLDIAIEDRFNDDNGTLYRVVFVSVNRDVDTQAEAIAVE